MAINFPNSPNPNDTHSSGGKTWIWDGTSWKLNSTAAATDTNTTYSLEALLSPGVKLTGSDSTTDSVFFDSTGGISITRTTAPGPDGGGTIQFDTSHNHSFTSITGTPSSYDNGKWLQSTANGVEWVTAPSGSDTNDYVSGASLVAQTLTLTRTGSQSLSDVTVDLSSLNNVPTNITVADESQDTECYPLFAKDPTGDIDPKTGTNLKFNSLSGQLEAGSFKKTGGSAAEFLKADGSIDTTTYLSSVALNDLSNVDATTNLANGKILKYDLGSTTWVVADDNASGGGSANFTGLSDTPSAHSNDKWLKSNGSALIWADAPSSTTINNNADNRIITGSATTGELNAESNLTFDGNNLKLEDSKKITFGSNLRMEVYTDGTTNYIKSATDGGGAFPISIHSGSSEVINIDDGNTQIKTGLKDKDGDLGTSGQILSSTGTQVNWIDAAAPSIPNLNEVLGQGNTSALAATVGDLQCNNLTVTGTTTTVNSNTVNIGDNILTLNSDESGTPSQNGGIEIERGTSTNVSLRWNETTDKWQYTNDGSTFSDIGSSTTDTNTTYGISALDATGGAKIRLTGTNPSTTDDVTLKAGTQISITRSNDEITITNNVVSIGNLNDVTISGSPAVGSILEYNGSQWVVGSASGADGNNYPTSLSFNTSNGVLTLNRSGLSAITVDLDNRYSTTTITNNNQITNGANYVTSSGTITNSEKIRVRTDTGNSMHNLVFVDSYTDNQFQVLKVDNATDSLCYNPSANRLIAQDLQSFRMTSWTGDYGDYGQFLMSVGSGDWEWSQTALMKSNGELLLKRTDTSLEGGHLQFEDSDGNQAYAIDVYGTATSNSVFRVIDQNSSTERFSVNRSGAFGIGHVGARNFGSSGNVLISQGSGSQPIWGSLSQASMIEAQVNGTTPFANGNDIDDIYTQLNAIGNDGAILTVAQLKAALLALAKSL